MGDEAPRHAYLSRHWSNYTEHSCQFSYERKYQDDIEYVRAQPPTADAEMVARNLIQRYYNEGAWKAKADAWLFNEITTALSAAKQQGADGQREKDARRCEDLVTYTEDHGDQEPCKYCLALETAAMIIRSNQ